nr:MAG TPA: hypothetical protein [Caudoviricetes sp.]
MKSERTAGGYLPVRLGWGPPENDASSPHELDQDQSSDRGHVSPERPERRRCAAVT